MRQDLRRANPLDVNLGAIALSGAEYVARKHPIKLSLNFLGLFLLFFAVGLAPSEQAWSESAALMPTNADLRKENEAEQLAYAARAQYRASSGWFTCDGECPKLRAASEQADARWKMAKDKNAEGNSLAKQKLGLFSSSGVAETKNLFWRTFAGGQAYAKRATLWDALFAGMRAMGRDEALANFLIQMFFRLLMNVTVGIFSGCLQFIFMVPSIIASYRADWVSAILFFFMCACAATSFFVTSALLIASVGTATVVGAGALLTLQNSAAARQSRRVGGADAHYRRHQD